MRRSKEEARGVKRSRTRLSAHSRWVPRRPPVRATSWFAAAAARKQQLPERNSQLATEDGGGAARQRQFWAASMVLTTALPAPVVHRLKLSDCSITSHIDVCGCFKFCPQAKGGRALRAVVANSFAQLCNHLKEGARTWGAVSSGDGAPLLPRASAAACEPLSVCRCARRRTAVAISFDSGHDPGG